jgi:hypothetical protein
LFGGDLTLADGPFPTGVGIFEDVETVVHIVVVPITFEDCTSKSSGEEKGYGKGGEMHRG